jgi:hypothetical protein
MAQPQLHRAKVYPVPQMPRGKCRPELVQPEIVWVEFCALGNGLEVIEEVELRIAARRREDGSRVLHSFDITVDITPA